MSEREEMAETTREVITSSKAVVAMGDQKNE